LLRLFVACALLLADSRNTREHCGERSMVVVAVHSNPSFAVSVVRFTPLSGAKTTDPLCYLLQIDECRILLDCGCDDSFELDALEPLQRVAESVDFVLLSHADLSHLGALAIAHKRFGLRCPIYATIPVFTMGQMYLYDAHQAQASVRDFDAFSLDDVDDVFATVRQLKYSQHVRLGGKGKGIQVTPYAAGHSLGGTLWKISKENEDVIYAVDYNHKKERHLNPTVLETLTRPTLLITDARNALVTHRARSERDKELLETISKTLKPRGNVLLPVDTAGRSLELLQLLNHHWTHFQLANSYTLVFFNHVAYNVIEFAKSQVEWLSDDIARRFEATRVNAFDMPAVRVVHSMEELKRLKQPYVVMASMETLNCGPAKELFLAWASDPRNLILFTQMPPETSLGHQVLTAQPPCTISVDVSRRVALEGQELINHQLAKRAEQEALREASAAAAMAADDEEASADMDDDDDDNNDNNDDGDDGRGGDGGAAAAAAGATDGDADMDDKADSKAALADSMALDDEKLDLKRTVAAAASAAAAAAAAQVKSAVEVATTLFAASNDVRGAQFLERGVRAPLFPPPSPLHESDDYGERFDLALWASRSAANEDTTNNASTSSSSAAAAAAVKRVDLTARGAATGAAAGGAAGAGSAAGGASLEEETPMKTVEETVHVQMRMRAHYIDFEGRSDGKSVRTILAHVEPRKVILVHGTSDAMEELATHCRQKMAATCRAVLTPDILESIDVTSDTNMYRIRLSEALLNTLTFQRVGQYELTYVDGRVSGGELGSDLTLNPLPADDVSGHRAVFVGDARLVELKRILIAEGFDADLSSGVLVCGGKVMVRKVVDVNTGEPTLRIDGVLCADYFKIRTILQRSFRVL
jgi:Cft2 family RNA processing exonuclease